MCLTAFGLVARSPLEPTCKLFIIKDRCLFRSGFYFNCFCIGQVATNGSFNGTGPDDCEGKPASKRFHDSMYSLAVDELKQSAEI